MINMKKFYSIPICKMMGIGTPELGCKGVKSWNLHSGNQYSFLTLLSWMLD